MVVKKLFLLFLLGFFALSFVSAASVLNIQMNYPVGGADYDSKVTHINWAYTGNENSICFYSLDNGNSYNPVTCNLLTIPGLNSDENTNNWKMTSSPP